MPFFERDEQNNIQTVNNFARAEVMFGLGTITSGTFEEFGLHNPDGAILASAAGFIPLMVDSIVWRMGRSSASYPWTKGTALLLAATVPTAVLALSGHPDVAAYTSLATQSLATGLRTARTVHTRR